MSHSQNKGGAGTRIEDPARNGTVKLAPPGPEPLPSNPEDCDDAQLTEKSRLDRDVEEPPARPKHWKKVIELYQNVRPPPGLPRLSCEISIIPPLAEAPQEKETAISQSTPEPIKVEKNGVSDLEPSNVEKNAKAKTEPMVETPAAEPVFEDLAPAIPNRRKPPVPIKEVDRELSNRTRFFTSLASLRGVRYSALVYLVIAHTSRAYLKHRRRGLRASLRITYDELGKALACSGRHAQRLVDDAVKRKDLGCQRVVHGLLLWSNRRKFYLEKVKADTGQKARLRYFYYLDLAKDIGINASVLLALLLPQPEDDEAALLYTEAPNITAVTAAKVFPWMCRLDAYHALEKLVSAKLAQKRKVTGHNQTTSVYEYIAL